AVTLVRLHELLQLHEPVVCDAGRPCCVVAIAAGHLGCAALEQDDLPTAFRSRVRSREPGVAAADHDDVCILHPRSSSSDASSLYVYTCMLMSTTRVFS